MKRSRVRTCALSAGWTGSCQPDEKDFYKEMLAVQVLHPAAAITEIPAMRGLRTTAKEVFLCFKLENNLQIQ